VPALRASLSRIDRAVPVENLRTLADQALDTITLDRLIGALSSGFALLATLLAAIGLYGVVSWSLTQRTRELGLRIALGATVARLRRMVLRDVAQITAIGCMAGAITAFVLGRIIESLLFNVPGYDAFVMLATAAGIALVALGAGAIPARRASRVDAMTALRCD
jgi:putative ABC transport system permease protein